MPIRHNHTATGTNDGTKQVSVDRWNESHVIDDGLTLPAIADPAPPSSGDLIVYAKSVGGRSMLAQMGSSGRDTSFQPHLGGNKTALWMPPGNGTTVPGVLGMAALTALGSASARNVATTSLLTRMTRLGYASAATAGSLCGARVAAAQYTTGAGGGLGGFHLRTRFGISDAAFVADARMFIGMQAATTAPTNVDPPTIANCIGVAQVDGSANLHIVSRQGTGTATVIDLGADFPCNFGSVDAYELSLFSPPVGGCRWQVNRLNHPATATGVLAGAEVPVGTTLLSAYNSWRCNNATALAVALDICSIYIESDF
jgi:hypothetical protein